jgi:hypothetical protein
LIKKRKSEKTFHSHLAFPAFGCLEVMRKLVCTLDAGIAYVTDLLGIEQFPFFVVEFGVEIHDELWVDEVEEGVPDIAIILNHIKNYLIIDRQIKEINFLLMIFVEQFEQ